MMRSLALGAAATLLSSHVALAAGRFGRSIQGDGFLKLPVGTVDRPKKTKRDEDPIVMIMDNMDFFYAADLEIGSPGQSVTVLVDTGSSELWFNPDCDTAPSTSQARQCRSFGHYNPDDSETPARGPSGLSEIYYGDPSDPTTHTSVEIEYYSDDIMLGNATIANQTFGLVTESEGISQGIMGLAPDMRGGFDEAHEPYPLLLHNMAEQGLISSRTFALDLRHAEAETGAIIYGGIDRNKFIGNLESMPIVRGSRGEYRLSVEIDKMGITLDDESSEYELEEDDMNVMLDSGTTMTRLHAAAAGPILRALDAEDVGDGFYYTPCSMREEAGSVDFVFGNKTVRVPFSDFVIEYGDPFYCAIGVVLTTDQQIIGDSVLRAGYFVFDWDNEAVYIAQAANCGEEDIVAAGKDGNDLTDVEGNCQEKDALFTSGPISTSATATSTSGPESTGGDDRNDSEGSNDDSSNSSNDDDDDDNAGVRSQGLNVVLLIAGAFALGVYTIL